MIGREREETDVIGREREETNVIGREREETNVIGRDRVLKVIARRGKHDYLVWHHVARQRTFSEIIRKNVKWAQALRAARLMFLVVVTAYALWYRAMCVDIEVEAASHDAAAAGGLDGLEAAAEAAAKAAEEAAEAVDGATGVGAGFDDRADAIQVQAKLAAARAAAKAAAAKAAAMKPSPLTMLAGVVSSIHYMQHHV